MTAMEIQHRQRCLDSTFFEKMRALPQLSEKLLGHSGDGLLHGLYTIALQKTLQDTAVENWSKTVAKVRRAEKSMLRIKNWIQQAADCLDKINEEPPVQLEYLDEWTAANQESLFSNTLHDILRSLTRLGKDAAVVEAMIAANVHPAVRTPRENLLVESHRLSDRSKENLRFLTPKTPAIDHWFIGAADDRLEQYENETGRRITGKVKIIARMFEILGEPGRTEDSISKELQRQKTLGRPGKPTYDCPQDDRYGPDLLP